MNSSQKLNHATWDCKYHLVWIGIMLENAAILPVKVCGPRVTNANLKKLQTLAWVSPAVSSSMRHYHSINSLSPG